MPRDNIATDPPVSEAQRRAMEAAAHGHSTLGIPKRVGQEFVGDSDAGHAAGVILVAPDGDILLLRRSSTESNYPGHWALPGGKAEGDEAPHQAAAREMGEEIGAGLKDASGMKLFDRRATSTGMVFSTYAHPVAEKFAPKLNAEHSGYAWAPPGQLPEPLHPGVKASLAERLHEGRAAEDMSPEEWSSLRTNFAKWTREEEREDEHQGEDAEERFTKAEVNYSPGKGDSRCGRCAHYQGNGACELVAGTINPDAWCELFKVKRTAADSHRIALDKATVRRIDQDGHMHVKLTPISKANVCPYKGEEIPEFEALGLQPDKIYNLLRDPEELAKGAPSFAGKPLLLVHTPISAEEHPREVTVGSVGTDVQFSDPYLMAPLTVWDGEAIGLIEDDEQRELSCAYHYRADMTPGTYKGEAYDGVMRDIKGNHVALVKEGRAGPDVLVGDSKPQPEMHMSTKNAVLSRVGAVAHGALMTHLRPRLAKDARIDLRSVLASFKTAKDFKSGKAKLATDIKTITTGKLAKDANVADVVKLLDELEEDVEAVDMEPSAALPQAKAMDNEPESRKFLASKLSAEDMKAYDDMMSGEQEAMDEAEEDDEEKKKKEAADKAARDAAEEGGEPKVTKKAMDQAISTAVKQAQDAARKEQRAVREAEEIVRPYVGRLAIACDSAADVYKAALGALNVDISDVHPSAYRAILQALPLPNGRPKEQPAPAMDAAAADSFTKLFGNHAVQQV